MLAMRAYMRRKHVDGVLDATIVARVGLTERQVEERYRYMEIADYEDRFLLPTTHQETAPYASDHSRSFASRSGRRCPDGARTTAAWGTTVSDCIKRGGVPV